MTERGKRPIPDSYWVRPGRLLAGEYPGAPHDADARRKLHRLLEAGVTFFLDLTEAGEYGLRPYAPLLHRGTAARKHSAEHWRMPVPDRGTPTSEEMVRILDTIGAALAADHTVYVHCYGGIGRTGTVIGCYLVRRGMSGPDALAEIARLRQGTPDGYRVSPETEAQRQMVLNWVTGK
jgi:hypothetical protein